MEIKMTEPKSILRAAICEFKKNVEKITKDNDNPFFKSKYADLATILNIIDKPLAEAGLAITSNIEYLAEDLICRTNLTHKDSDEVATSIFPIFGAKPQEIGSSVTYARRYNIQALLNLAAEDDDGNKANEGNKVKKPISAATNKAKYEEYMGCLKKVTTKEMYLEVKPKKDAWVIWVKNNYAQEWADQLNDAFLKLAGEYDNPLPKERPKAEVKAEAPKSSSKDLLGDDEVPSFLK